MRLPRAPVVRRRSLSDRNASSGPRSTLFAMPDRPNLGIAAGAEHSVSCKSFVSGWLTVSGTRHRGPRSFSPRSISSRFSPAERWSARGPRGWYSPGIRAGFGIVFELGGGLDGGSTRSHHGTLPIRRPSGGDLPGGVGFRDRKADAGLTMISQRPRSPPRCSPPSAADVAVNTRPAHSKPLLRLWTQVPRFRDRYYSSGRPSHVDRRVLADINALDDAQPTLTATKHGASTGRQALFSAKGAAMSASRVPFREGCADRRGPDGVLRRITSS